MLERVKVAPLFASHSFWNTQPVVKFEEAKKEAVRQGPLKKLQLQDVPTALTPLPEGFEWATLDVNTKDLDEVYELLRDHYVEDEGLFRMKFTPQFLRWVFNFPGQHKDWIAGIRLKDTKELISFVSASPVKARFGEIAVEMGYVSFVTVSRKFRSKRLFPRLMQEMTRRINLKSIWQVLFTSSKVIPTPFCETWFYQRFLNYKMLCDVVFSVTVA